MRAVWVWLALLVTLWLTCVLCTHWEPVLGDGWGHFDYQRRNGDLWFFAKYNYLEMNPRLGQVITLLLFAPGPWHVIVTPLVEVGMFVLFAALVLGRWPSPRRLDDALMFATIVALVFATGPVLGPMLFYRPFTGNYLYGLVIGLAFLVPYRFHLEQPRSPSPRLLAAPPMLVLGAAAGMCNEHTGPALAALAIAACVHARRPPAWMIAGALGVIAGGLALYFAPGQGLRYAGLAHQASLLGRIADRGLGGNAIIVWRVVRYLLPALVWIALAEPWREREPITGPRKLATVALAGAAVVVTLALLLSPKQGERLSFAAVVLACAAIASWAVPRLTAVWARGAAWVLAGGVIAFVAWRCVSLYAEIGGEWDRRLAALEHAAPHSTVRLVRYAEPHSHWFMGEDLGAPNKRAEVAATFGLAAVELEGQRDATPSSDDP